MNPSTRTFYIAGVKFRPDYRMVMKQLEEAQQKTSDPLLDCDVKLIGEPSNQYDRYAVKVLLNEIHCGYIPRPINIDVWTLRDARWKPHARLVEFDPDAPTHLMFKVEVTFTQELAATTVKP